MNSRIIAALAAVVSMAGLAGTLPPGYTQVDYIESTGSQYIDTGYVHTANTRAVCVANVGARQYGTYAVMFGARNGGYTKNAFTFYSKFGGSGSVWNRTGQQTAATAGNSVPTGVAVEIACEGQVATWHVVDDPTRTGTITTTGTVDGGLCTLFLFGANMSSAPNGFVVEKNCTAVMKLHSFKLFEDGELVRDFVPCVTPNGVAGLYDLVEGKFHGNLGAGRFFLPGETEMYFARGWLEPCNEALKQYVNTGYHPVAATRIETIVHPYARTDTWSSLFGVMTGDNSTYGVLVRFYNGSNTLNGFFCNNTYGEATIPITPDTDLNIVLQAGSFSIGDQTATITTVNAPYDNSLYLFCENNGDEIRRWQYARFQTFKISENGVMKRDYVPAWRPDNEVSFYDRVEGVHYPSVGPSSFTCWGELSYFPSGTTLTVFDGKLRPEDVVGFTAIEKKGLLAMDASAVTALPDLTVSGGVLSLCDGVATAHAVGTLTLAEGARIEVDVTTGGVDSLAATSVVLPETGVITIAPTGPVSANSTFAVLSAPGLDASRFRVDGRALSGGSATIVVGEGGAISLQLSNDTMPFIYHGPSINTLWGGGDLVWQNAKGATVAWENGADVVFDGSGAAGAQVADTLTVGSINFAGTADFTLTGAGTIGGVRPFTKNGSGTLTLNGPNFANQEIVINGGKVVLGENAGTKSLGECSTSGGGSVTVNAGGQFNLNYVGEGSTAGSNTNPRQEITHAKVFKIAGEGPDGRGAIINDALDGRTDHTSGWNSAFRRIELADDAAIGGTDRVDVRVRVGTAATSAPGVYGPGKTLTVKNTANFALVSQPIDVGAVKISDGGEFRPENLTAAQINIPGGMILDNGTLQAYGTTWPATMQLRTTENGGAIKTENGTTTFNGSVDVPANSELRLVQGGASATVNFMTGITNNGVVTVSGGTWNVMGGALAGDGVWNQTGGSLFWYAATDLVKPRTLNLSGGTFFYGKETDEVAPLNQKLTVNATGGQFAFNIGKPCTITSDDVEFSGNPTHVHFMSRNDDTTYVTLEDFTATATSQMIFGNGSNGRYHVGNGVELNTAEFYLNGNGKISDVTFHEGSTLTASSNFKLGNNAAATSTLVLDGGTIDLTTKSTLGWVWMGVNANQVDFTVNAGTLTTWGILCRTGWKDPATFGEQFTMNGGTLNITGDAIRGWTHFNHFCEFNNGTVNSLEDWHVEQMRSSGFGSRPGGHVDFQLHDKTVNWATGLAGVADVTVKGTGTLKSGTGEKSTKLFMQGALTGKWTIENSGENDLSGASAFLGGLELAEGVSAKVHIAGSNLVEAVYLQTAATAVTKTDSLKRGYPYLCNDLKTMHEYDGSATYDKGQFMWQGMFYADTAGTWAFAGSYDDYLGLEIDGEWVLDTTSWNVVNLGTKELSEGWHDFRVIQYQNGGGWGCPVAGWKNVMNLGFRKSSNNSLEAKDYQRFDNHNLPMRSGPVTATNLGMVNWSSVKGYDASTWKTREDLAPNGLYKMSDLNTYNVAATPTFSGSTHQFDGWFFVKATMAGDWTVNVNYDDQGDLWIDDVDIGADGSKQKATVVTVNGVTPGWHRFKLRVADNSGNWGPWSNAGTCVTVTVNGNAYKFDESAFSFSAVRPAEYAGLDGELTLNAGSTLNNDQTVDACPIWGTLKGTGTLSGKFAFVGVNNCWAMDGTSNRRNLAAATFDNAEATALAGLKKIKVTFDGKPICGSYVVGPALGANPAEIVVEVQDEAGKDYSEGFKARIRDGQLQLENLRSQGTILFIK